MLLLACLAAAAHADGRPRGSLFGDYTLNYGVMAGVARYVMETGLEGNVKRRLMLSGRVLTRAEAHGTLDAARVRLGILAAAVDTAHVDLDAFLSASVDAPGLARLRIAPGFELRWDRTQEASPYGLYGQVSLRYDEHRFSRETPGKGSAVSVQFVLGAYFSRCRHRVSLEYALITGELLSNLFGIDSGGRPKLGYRLRLTDAAVLELHAYAQIPNGPERWGMAGGVGLSARLRRGRR